MWLNLIEHSPSLSADVVVVHIQVYHCVFGVCKLHMNEFIFNEKWYDQRTHMQCNCFNSVELLVVIYRIVLSSSHINCSNYTLTYVVNNIITQFPITFNSATATSLVLRFFSRQQEVGANGDNSSSQHTFRCYIITYNVVVCRAIRNDK